ncbi:MAG TPA: hypothetical protein VN416_02215 [Desulfomonilia bacterium]|nr:hypothetical protein [Desulfomonilia bacterium]
MSTDVHDSIAAIRRGEDVRGLSDGLIVNGQPDAAALQALGRELATAEPEVREKIVDLLVEVGLQTDPLTPAGAEVLRDKRIIAILAGPGLVKADLGREAAMDALRKLVMQADLAPHEDAFVKALLDAPGEEAFLLVAKAKPEKGKVLVDQLARSQKWQENESARIARAALGAKDVEDAYLAGAEAAKDGKELAEALGPLALMGTQRSLKAIAALLRTPLTILVPGAFEKSVRLNVLEALLYNYPDQPVLYPNNIVTEEDYTAAELFCTKTLGVTYTTPPPPFMTYRGFPRF